ncbi:MULTISPECIES: hypothetical protein [Pseudomonas]|uniref:hypothetical protein n=1 Tax=Pseudomonas sp. YuFO8 TaxID=3095361 RepID=UPI002B250F8A|nr:hypothetical protein [Pseudomonas sp. YuFO8]MEB2624733.1 hypothetical protein [Pseudomonas sp. YuFO8]
MSSYNSRYSTPSGVCRPASPNMYGAHRPPSQRQFDCDDDQGPRKQVMQKEIGLLFEWDNGEQLGPNMSCHLTIGGETTIYGLMDGKKLFCQTPPGKYEAQLLRNVNAEEKLNEARQQLKKALDAIIEHEKEEAAALKKIQDSQHIFIRPFHLLLAMGRGFFHSLWGFIKSTKELSDLVNPFTSLSNALAAAWTAKRDDGTSWVQSFSKNYSDEQHREITEALGFDPEEVSREKLAEAYEIACFIYEDARSREILKNFAGSYIDVQNIEEKMEFGGSVVFEIVLNALLIATTGGAGNAARFAVSSPLLKLLKSLEEALQNLTRWIINHTVKSTSHVKGTTGTSAVTVVLRRPKEIIPDEISNPPVPNPASPKSDKWSREPRSIQDQMTLQAAKDGQGVVIIEKLKDPTFEGMNKVELKVKSKNGQDSVVHYVKNPSTGELMDFKFKKHSAEGVKPWGNDPAVWSGEMKRK